jgi:hypothetical protein
MTIQNNFSIYFTIKIVSKNGIPERLIFMQVA